MGCATISRRKHWPRSGTLGDEAEAGLREGRADLVNLLLVTGLHPDFQEAAGDRHIRIGAVVMHGDDIGTALRHDLAHLLELARLILERDHQVRVAAAHDEAAGDDAGQDVHVDVAAADQADDLLALDRELPEHRGSDRNGTGTLGDQLLVLDEGEDRSGGLILADGHDIVHVLLDHLEGGLARILHSDTIRKGRNTVEGLPLVIAVSIEHARRTGRLYTIDLALRTEALDREGDTGDQSAATDRHDDRIHILELVEDLETDRALACDDRIVVVRMDEGHARLLLELDGLVMRVVVGALHEADLCTETLRALDLHDRRTIRHTDDALDAHLRRRERDTLRVIAGAAGHDTVTALLLAQLTDLIVGAAHLEAAGHLQVLGLEIHLRVRHEPRRRDEVRLPRHIL